MYSVIVYLSGSAYYVKDWDGAIVTSNADKTLAVQAAINHLVDGGSVVCKDFEVPGSLSIPENVTVQEFRRGKVRNLRTLSDGYTYILGEQSEILDAPSIPKWHTLVDFGGILKEGYLVNALKAEVPKTSASTFEESVGFGTYEWKGKARGDTEAEKYIGWCFYADPSEWSSLIEVLWNGTPKSWEFATWNAGSGNRTKITGIDFAVEHKFRIEWSTSIVKLYVDDILKDTHTTNIPQVRLYPFQQCVHLTKRATASAVYSKDWRKLA